MCLIFGISAVLFIFGGKLYTKKKKKSHQLNVSGKWTDGESVCHLEDLSKCMHIRYWWFFLIH